MQSILVNPIITQDKILSLEDYLNIEKVKEYILYADNILEGITILNDLTEDTDFLEFYGVVYQPINQPIYIFKDEKEQMYAIKVCGAYDKWNLPKQVSEIINFIDLPDYVLYSIENQKVILAGENTETASVGNSQWQREGRKLGAGKISVPFIYQTFYSGRDESLSTIREPNSLQAYNQLVYSVRYKTPSFVSYFENNFENSQTRIRNPKDSKDLLSQYIKVVILSDTDAEQLANKKAIEKKYYLHMLAYLKEKKSQDLSKENKLARLYYDLPSLKDSLLNEILENSENFVDKLIEYLYETDTEKIYEYLNNCDLLNLYESKFENWNSYNNKAHICELLSYLKANNITPKSYINRSAKVGFVPTKSCNEFLKNKFPSQAIDIEAILDCSKYPVSVLMPLRIHKKSNGKITFSPDPESGEIVAFSELFSYDIFNKKKRPVIGYCIVDTPEGFDINDKYDTKLYKAIARYVDILIINGDVLITDLSINTFSSDFIPNNLINIKPTSSSEEMAVVSSYLNQTTINSDWKMCFIHTHHSSWQQLVIHNLDSVVQQKIDRVSTKVDLILQKNNVFMIAEGKNNFRSIMADSKIKTAMKDTSDLIDRLYGRDNFKFDALIYNLHTSSQNDLAYCLSKEIELVNNAIQNGEFNNIAYHESYVVIIVYLNTDYETKFKLIFSPDFDEELKLQLEEEFDQ